MKLFCSVLLACATAVTGQALGQAPQPKKQKISKPVLLTAPAPKPIPKKSSKAVPFSGTAAKPKSPPKPALKVFRPKSQKLGFISGDRVMLIGDGLIEQMQKHGYLESRLTAGNSGKKLNFLNIGWSGDTPAGIARDGLGDTAGRSRACQRGVGSVERNRSST